MSQSAFSAWEASTKFIHSKWMTLPRVSAKQAAVAPHQGVSPPEGEVNTHHTVCAWVLGRWRAWEDWVGQPSTDSFLEEGSMGVSKQFTTFFKINIAFIHFFTS